LVPRPRRAGFAELRIAVVSPFVDRRHGTERAVAELVERLARIYHCEVHLYAQRAEDLKVSSPGGRRSSDAGAVIWHKIPSVPGPQLLQFVCWLVLNSLYRWWDRTFRRLRFDCLFSPGINCLSADVILVHAVFQRLAELQALSVDRGVRSAHRRLYYRLLRVMERRVYCDPRVAVAAVSQHTAGQLQSYFGRSDVAVIPNGVDVRVFNAEARKDRRAGARLCWNFAPHEHVVLLIGNDWRTKGLDVLLEAASLCRDLPLRVLVVGQEDASLWAETIGRRGLTGRVLFSAPSAKVIDFLAAADLYVAPSREDSFHLPALEAMACGLPVIVSRNAGASEWVHDGLDGVILQEAENAAELGDAIRQLVTDPEARQQMGENAVRTAATLSWDRHAETIYKLLRGNLAADGSY
jgi:UDP-glucose:(heptosyl)LPS alpha-1,3-glucosyltransferase